MSATIEIAADKRKTGQGRLGSEGRNPLCNRFSTGLASSSGDFNRRGALPASGRLDSRCRLTFPKAVRDALGLQPNDSVIFLIEGDSVSMRRRPQSFTKALADLHQEVWNRSDEWLENERSGWEQARPGA